MDINPFKSKFIYKIQLFVFDNKFKCCYFNEFRMLDQDVFINGELIDL